MIKNVIRSKKPISDALSRTVFGSEFQTADAALWEAHWQT